VIADREHHVVEPDTARLDDALGALARIGRHEALEHDDAAVVEEAGDAGEARTLGFGRRQQEERVEGGDDDGEPRRAGGEGRRRVGHVAEHGADGAAAGSPLEAHQHRRRGVHAPGRHAALGERHGQPPTADTELQHAPAGRELGQRGHCRVGVAGGSGMLVPLVVHVGEGIAVGVRSVPLHGVDRRRRHEQADPAW
jgi:hypothetical protein